MADRMQALKWDIVRLIGRFAGAASPIDKRMPQAVANLLLLLVQNLLRHFLPHETQVASGWNHSHTDGFPGREQQQSFISIVFLTRQKFLNGRMGQITCSKDVRDGHAGLA